jgi:7-cyano-7-deazaguanine synthase
MSGGLYSAVTATIAKCERLDLYILTFDYGQRNRREIEAAKQIAHSLRAKEHKILPVPLAEWGGSALTDANRAVPKGRSKKEMESGIPDTYVPARNTVFLALGLSYAEAIGADSVFIGAHQVDYSGYPDCRPEYFEKFQELVGVGTKRGVEGNPIRIVTPLLGWSKAKIVETGHDLKAPMKHAWSCYEGGPEPCGDCDSCRIRADAFAQAGLKDPALAASPA